VRFVVVANGMPRNSFVIGEGIGSRGWGDRWARERGGGGTRRGRCARGMMRNGARARGRGDSTRTRETEDARIGENDGATERLTKTPIDGLIRERAQSVDSVEKGVNFRRRTR